MKVVHVFTFASPPPAGAPGSPIADRFDVDNGLLLPCRRQFSARNVICDAGCIEFPFQPSAELLNECSVMNEEVIRRSLPSDRLTVTVQHDSATRHNKVYVRVIRHWIASPRVEDSEVSEFRSSQHSRIGRHTSQGFIGRFEQDAVTGTLIRAQRQAYF